MKLETKMFTKMNIKFNRPTVSEIFKGKYINTYGLISYYQVKKSYLIVPIELLRLQPDKVTWTEVSPEANLPHRDHGVRTNLNMYIDPGVATTKFYRIRPGAVPYTTNAEHFYPNLFYHKDLDYYGEFQANPYETYLLDVSQVHEVVGIESGVRSMIQLSWVQKPFEQVLNEIGEKNVF